MVPETPNLNRKEICEFIPVDDATTDESDIAPIKSSSSALNLVDNKRSEGDKLKNSTLGVKHYLTDMVRKAREDQKNCAIDIENGDSLKRKKRRVK